MQEFLSALQSASIIIAALMGAYGLDAWRREFVGKRKMELAEEVLALCYETKEIIDFMRSPGGFSGEGESRIQEPGESEGVKTKRNNAFIPIERHNQHIEKLSRLWTLSYRFRAQFSDSEAQPIDDLRNIIVEIKSAAHMLYVCSQGEETMSAQAQKTRSESQGIVWTGHQTPDPIAPKIEQAIATIEATCKGVLMSKSTLFGWINTRLS